MKQTLKSALINELKQFGYISTNRAEEISRSLGHKASTYERILRHDRKHRSGIPDMMKIKKDFNEKGFITGYRWLDFGKEFLAPSDLTSIRIQKVIVEENQKTPENKLFEFEKEYNPLDYLDQA